jgi:cell volume regulation protein A
MDATLVFSIVGVIILIGFAGEFLFKKTGIPIFIFLIITGIILGPVLAIFPREPLMSSLSIFAELTLLMVLFYGGLGLKSESVIASGGRALIQTVIYVLASIFLIGLLGTFVLNWGLLPSFIFASMIGGETTAAVVVPLTKSMKLSEKTVAFLTMESAMNSIFSVILFFAFTGVYLTGGSNLLAPLSNIAAQFSVGIGSGALLAIGWIVILYRLQKQKFTYVLTLGLILITYAIASELGGNGILAVLVFGIMLGNHYLVSKLFRRKINISILQSQFSRFQEEITFLMETLFFVFLGLTFVINPSLFYINLSLGIVVVFILMFTRLMATRVSTFRSELSSDKKTIVLMCAQGLTPATLAILAVGLQIPFADTFLNIVTYVIIFTNIVTTAGAFINHRSNRRAHQ